MWVWCLADEGPHLAGRVHLGLSERPGDPHAVEPGERDFGRFPEPLAEHFHKQLHSVRPAAVREAVRGLRLRPGGDRWGLR